MARHLEAIVVVLDVGISVGQQLTANGKTFLKNAQLCATNIIQRKILSGSKDELALIILGSKETNNPLADGEQYENIEIVHSFQTAKWDMVRTIANYDDCTTCDGDWLDALIVAADYMRSATEGKRFKEKKIVILTNFCSNVSDDMVDDVIEGLKNEEVQILAIGPELRTESDSQESPLSEIKSEEQQEGEKLITKITNTVPNSLVCGFEQAIPQLQHFEQKKVRPSPWKCIMEIGSNIKIPVVGYKKVAPVKTAPIQNIVVSYNNRMGQIRAASARQDSATDNGTVAVQGSESQDSTNGTVPERKEIEDDVVMEIEDGHLGMLEKDRIYVTAGNDAAPVESKDIIEGYMFGTTLVPVTDDDKPSLAYYSGPKSLSVVGFTQKQNVPLHLHSGDGCYQFFPENQEHCMKAFAALIQAMDSKDLVAIVRKVYRQDCCPVMCALFPVITPECQSFVAIELPFSEDVKVLLFPPLAIEKNQPTQEQLNAVGQLIHSMDLMQVDDEEDAETGLYDPHSTLDPYEQHFHSIVAQKALNKDKYFSGSDVHDSVKVLLAPNKELSESAKPALGIIKKLFTLTEIVPKEGARKAAADVFKPVKPDDLATPAQNQTLDVKKASISHIGTVNPQEDFKKVINEGVPLEKACSLMTQVIADLVAKAFDDDDFNKPYKCLVFMRKVCVDEKPSVFNEWISKYKSDLPHEKIGFWQLIVNDQAGLISSSESKLSDVSEEAVKQFLQLDDMKDETLQPESVDEDLDDLINQM